MDRITLHRADADNAGLFCDAGETLAIGDQAAAGVITADRAQALLDNGGAVDVTEATEPAPTPAAEPLDLDHVVDDDHAG